jgi:hypothetical protein
MVFKEWILNTANLTRRVMVEWRNAKLLGAKTMRSRRLCKSFSGVALFSLRVEIMSFTA